MRSRLEFILIAVERIDLTVYDENIQFEFFQKEKVSRTRFVTGKILFSIHFFELWFKKPLKMTNFSSKCTVINIGEFCAQFFNGTKTAIHKFKRFRIIPIVVGSGMRSIN